jgi:DNA-binding NarL/FixJ family response regulator
MVRSVRILLVDDYAPIRERIRQVLQKQSKQYVVDEASDGLQAVQKASDLKPDLILLDVGLPMLNGIEAARRIRELSPKSKILFLSEFRSSNFASEALKLGASGYIVKSDAAKELLPGIETVLDGGQFISSSLADHEINEAPEIRIRDHAAGFYSEDRHLLDQAAQFLATTLRAGASAVVAVTEPHRNRLREMLTGMDLEVDEAIRSGRYITVDADEALASVMVDGRLDPARFAAAFHPVLARASEASGATRPRVSLYGECVHLLCAQGNVEAAIQMEKLANRLFEKFDLRILCAYSVNGLFNIMSGDTFQRIRDEHSVVHFH